MISRIQITALILVVSGIWAVFLIIDGTTVSISWLRYLSLVTGAVLLLLALFDLWLWRVPLLQGWFVHRPNIRGTWKVTITSNWVNPESGEGIAPIQGYVMIRQTYSTLRLRLMTAESSSDLLGSEMTRSADGTFQVTGVYRNEPRLGVRERSPIHYGALLLYVPDATPTTLQGQYWTDRHTHGELTLYGRVSQLLTSYDASRRGFANLGDG